MTKYELPPAGPENWHPRYTPLPKWMQILGAILQFALIIMWGLFLLALLLAI